ncbi:AAA family ATPase [Neolewinella agarilytica]|uniref:Exonuclease SbcC n=1 Tax=Neolewinella agarilytica TaxID=478744 RepID=A0A1H9CB37_9BACT|nr:AAA family ATPase [Neolewinella agarilytica]SEP98450.1 exonuclease SbcC [Neolewinella agarilytica]
MRILRIGITNLNSLRGTQTIDFTTDPLASNQLYAIVGPTGAGKTTILDAITLALYGQTERNKDEKDRKDGSGSIMSYGEGECRAELEYETSAGRFRNVWHRQRAHKKPEKDLTASRREINKWNPKTEEWDLLATKKKEVDEQTVKTVGLDYERFVRSVMLTQGDFARFLKSKPGDKAAILEKITGTEIYKDLSIAAFARAKLAREAHDRATQELESSPPLNTEDRQRLNEQAIRQKAELDNLKKTVAKVVGQLALYEQLGTLQAKETTAKTEVERLEKAWSSASVDRDRLAKSDALQALRSDLEAELRLAQSLAKLTEDLSAIALEHTTLDGGLKVATEAIASAQEKLNDYYEKLPAREKKFAKVAELEREITSLQKDMELDQKRQKSLEQSLGEQRAKGAELEQSIVAIRRELAGLEPEKIRERLEALEGSIPLAGKEREALELRLNRRRTADRLAAEEALAIKANASLKASMSALTTAEKAVAEAELALKDRQLVVNNLRLSASLSEHKHNLKPGEECPVCGAIEHPGLKNFEPVTDSALERTQADEKRAQAELASRREALDKARRSETDLRRQVDGHQALISELSTQLGTVETEAASVASLAEQLKTLNERIQAESEEQSKLRSLQVKLPKLLTLETESASVKARVGELETELKAVTGTLEAARKAAAGKREKIRAEVGDRTAEECRELTRKKKEELMAALASAEKQASERKTELAALVSRQAVIREQSDKQTAELKVVRERLAAGLAEKGLSSDQARQTLLPENETLHLRARLNELTTERATAKSAYALLIAELAEAAKLTHDLPDRETLDKEKAQQEFAVSEADRMIGAIELQIKQDDARIAAVAEQQARLEGIRKEADRWARLNDLIGSADGKKFRSYAQAITLQQLIEVGNDHLRRINPRYRMAYEPPEAGGPEKLEMVIIDQYQNDNRRTIYTLSGGESFLISLALALGLSDLAGGSSMMQSLFIDEGFGTLDGKTLDQAMTTLEQLQAQGKTIGLISHVPQLRERIHCQIRLEPVGDGFSRLEVVDG